MDGPNWGGSRLGEGHSKGDILEIRVAALGSLTMPGGPMGLGQVGSGCSSSALPGDRWDHVSHANIQVGKKKKSMTLPKSRIWLFCQKQSNFQYTLDILRGRPHPTPMQAKGRPFCCLRTLAGSHSACQRLTGRVGVEEGWRGRCLS